MKGNLLLLACLTCHATVICAQSWRVPDPAAFTLFFAPDARAAGMGFAGTATSGDANAMNWNPGKLMDAPGKWGASANYLPWLPYLVNGSWVGVANAYTKLGRGQALGASVHYYKAPDFYSPATPPRDLAVSAAYAKQLGSHFSMGFTLRYISSQVPVLGSIGGPLQKADAVAGDIGAFYNSRAADAEAGNGVSWTVGATLSNIGPKLDYGGGTEYFLPTALRIGGGLSYTASRHQLNVTAEAGKLLIPTPVPGRNVNQKPYFQGIIASFSDAPDGFREELREVMLSMGAEYWYKKQFAIRGGYHAESKQKGGREFFSVGAGARLLKHYGIDFAYLIPPDRHNAMRNTYHASALVYF